MFSETGFPVPRFWTTPNEAGPAAKPYTCKLKILSDMYRRIVLLTAALLCSLTCFAGSSRKSRVSPFQYGNRWYISLQAGPQVTFSENSGSFSTKGNGWDQFTWQAGAAIGYNFTDAFYVRLSANYGRNVGALTPFAGYYPYHYNAFGIFADAMFNFNALGELNVPLQPKFYAGLGAALGIGYESPKHPFQVTEGPNLVPGIRLGFILEYDYPGGFGWFFDFATEGFTDWYDGLDPEGFPFDVNLKLSFGIIYHFPGARK